jgi:hypothetical protein
MSDAKKPAIASSIHEAAAKMSRPKADRDHHRRYGKTIHEVMRPTDSSLSLAKWPPNTRQYARDSAVIRVSRKHRPSVIVQNHTIEILLDQGNFRASTAEKNSDEVIVPAHAQAHA